MFLRRSPNPITAFIGVRISWNMFARRLALGFVGRVRRDPRFFELASRLCAIPRLRFHFVGLVPDCEGSLLHFLFKAGRIMV